MHKGYEEKEKRLPSNKNSIALDLEEGVFTWKNPRKIASSLKKIGGRKREKKSKNPYGNLPYA